MFLLPSLTRCGATTFPRSHEVKAMSFFCFMPSFFVAAASCFFNESTLCAKPHARGVENSNTPAATVATVATVATTADDLPCTNNIHAETQQRRRETVTVMHLATLERNAKLGTDTGKIIIIKIAIEMNTKGLM